jgi:DNA-binding NarL/FixJ family response regulator
VPRDDALVARIVWCVDGLENCAFVRATKRTSLPKGTGLAGRARERREPLTLASVAADNNFGRARAAALDGLHSGVAAPALAGDEVLAVVELHWAYELELTPRLRQSLVGIGQHLGLVLAQHRAELHPTRLTKREREVLQLASEGYSGPAIATRLCLSPMTIKSHFEHIYAKLRVSGRVAAVAHALRSGLIE